MSAADSVSATGGTGGKRASLRFHSSRRAGTVSFVRTVNSSSTVYTFMIDFRLSRRRATRYNVGFKELGETISQSCCTYGGRIRSAVRLNQSSAAEIKA